MEDRITLRDREQDGPQVFMGCDAHRKYSAAVEATGSWYWLVDELKTIQQLELKLKSELRRIPMPSGSPRCRA